MATGPSTSINPYLLAAEPNVRFTSILTVGDQVGLKADGVTPWRMVGIPDGLGAFDNGDGTISILMNHELGAGAGAVRDYGSKGAFQSLLTVDKATLQVVSAQDAIQHLELWNAATNSYAASTSYSINRFCSADLAAPTAYLDSAHSLGTADRIFLSGEEGGTEGKVFATIVTGAEKGMSFELPWLGKLAFENAVSNPLAQAKTVTVVTDDGQNGQVYVYVGDKQATGSTIEKAGLVGGDLFGIKVTGIVDETNATAANGAFTLVKMGNDGDVSAMTGAQLDAASETAQVTSFLRPEDAAWDPTNPNVLYFTTTNSFSGPSRLYKATFTDITHPELGGSIEAVLDGTEGQKMFDNLTVGADGKIILQEDVGGNAHLGRVFEYDPSTDKLSVIAEHDAALFTAGSPTFKTIDEESSGVIDVTGFLGDSDTRAYLLDVQSHQGLADPELVQDGQLLAMYIDKPVTEGDNLNNDLFGSQADETFNGRNGNDSIRAGSGNDRLFGGNGDDSLDAGKGDDQLDGGRGRDILLGGEGNDRLNGSEGDDRLVGGAGQDQLFGGKGSDLFVFTALTDSLVGTEDHIGDFSRGDRIDLSAIDASSGLAGDQGFTLATSFHGVAGELAVTKTGSHGQFSLVQGDVNGDSVADFAFYVDSCVKLAVGDFVL